MAKRQRGPHVVILTGLVGGGMAIATMAHDASAIFGLVLLGATLGAWFVVYEQAMCNNEHVSWSLMGAGAGLGAICAVTQGPRGSDAWGGAG